jgi:outer membrane lipoprotein SlyB
VGADDAAAARAIADDDGLPPAVGKPLRQHAGDVVGGAAGDERHDQLDLPAGVDLGLRRRDGEQRRGSSEMRNRGFDVHGHGS